MYEQFKVDHARVTHLDCEIEMPNKPELKPEKVEAFKYYIVKDYDLIIDHILECRTYFLDQCAWNLKEAVYEENIVSSSHQIGEKISFHLIIRSYDKDKNEMCFSSHEVEKKFMDEFRDFIIKHGHSVLPCIDFSIYSENRIFRLVDSSKCGSKRILKKHNYQKIYRDKHYIASCFHNKYRCIERDSSIPLQIVEKAKIKKEKSAERLSAKSKTNVGKAFKCQVLLLTLFLLLIMDLLT